MKFCRKYTFIAGLFAILLLFVGCATKKSGSEGVGSSEALSRPPTNKIQNAFSYLKVVKTNDASVELQVAVKKLVPLKGRKPEIWLVAVTHIGESNYYSELQRHLDKMSLVLFEGIRMAENTAKPSKPDSKKLPKDLKLSEPEKNPSKVSGKATDSIQYKLARSLGLVFQLEAIDYSKPNFENCDMNITQLEQIFSKETSTSQTGKEDTNQEWEQLKGLYLGDSLASVFADLLLKVVGSSPKMSAMMKIVFIESLSKIEGDFDRWEGMPEGMRDLLKVLIRERNNVIIARLREVLPRLKKQDSIALFYGAAHMYDLESRVCSEFKYKPTETIWFKAFGVDGEQYGISEFEYAFIRRLVENTIRQMKHGN